VLVNPRAKSHRRQGGDPDLVAQLSVQFFVVEFDVV
jgi:hypothetical protein